MRYRRSFFWIALGLGSLLPRFFLSEAQLESWYSRGLFLWIRQVLDALLTSWFPFPLFYAVIGGVVLFAVLRTIRFFRTPASWQQKVLGGLLGIGGFAGAIVFFFLFLWGYNYGRIPVENQLSLSLNSIPLDTLEARMRSEMDVLVQLRAQIPGADTTALSTEVFPDDLEEALRPLLVQTLQQYDFPTVGAVRCRTLLPEGVLLRISTAGVYFPWAAEGNIDGGLLPIQRVAIMAHELAHGYGFGDEGTCSFWAYLTCYDAPDPVIAYAGRLSYWRTLASTFRRARPEVYADYRAQLPAGVVADLNAINANLQRFPDIFPRARYVAYDTYLKAQGIHEGMLNYNRVTLLVEAWREK